MTTPASQSALSLCFILAFAGIDSTSGAGEGAYRNPVLPGDYPDPSVIRVGQDYWATATTSEWAPLFPILHSRDLINWEMIGSVFQQRPDWAVGNFWAPELFEYRRKYYLYYVGRRKQGPLSIAVATASQPSGPYTDHGPLISQEAGSIDPAPVVTDNGERYLIWKEDGNSRKLPTPLWIQKLSDDGTRLVGEMREILRNDTPWEGSLIEGPFVVKKAGWFYLFYSGNACCGRGCHYALGVARARTILGPWEKNPANPILAENDTWKCPGHGTVVDDGQGRDFLLYHAYHARDFVYVGRQGLLDEIQWVAGGWPKINNGKGPSDQSQAYRAPKQGLTNVTFSDDFTKGKLRPEWQWPQDTQPVVSFDLEKGLLLLGTSGTSSRETNAVLAVQTTAGNYVATAALLLPGAGETDVEAGLAAYGDAANALGITFKAGEATLWRRQAGKQTVLLSRSLPSMKPVEIRMTAKNGHQFRFAFRQAPANWTNLGDDLDVEGEHLPPWDRGVRVALIGGGSGKTAARFDWIRVERE